MSGPHPKRSVERAGRRCVTRRERSALAASARRAAVSGIIRRCAISFREREVGLQCSDPRAAASSARSRIGQSGSARQRRSRGPKPGDREFPLAGKGQDTMLINASRLSGWPPPRSNVQWPRLRCPFGTCGWRHGSPDRSYRPLVLGSSLARLSLLAAKNWPSS